MISRRLAQVSLAVAGLAVSVYLTAVHYGLGAVPLACAQGSVVNC